MSALGQKQTLGPFITTSALPPKADIVQRGGNVRFVPKADMTGRICNVRFTPKKRTSELARVTLSVAARATSPRWPRSAAPRMQCSSASCSGKRDGICGDIIQYLRADNKASAEKEIMATVSKLIFGAAIAAVSIATPALAQHASQSDPPISADHRQHLRVGSPPSDSPAFTSPPRDPRSWVGDPASRPYHYDPGWGGGP
jgi:hypothetical protein